MMTNDDDLAAQVRQALRAVIDPELGYNIVDLGFVYDVSVESPASTAGSLLLLAFGIHSLELGSASS